MDIDYALVWNFVDLDGRPRQLRFRRDDDPHAATDILRGTGQLIAVITDPQRPDRGDTIAVSRPGVAYTDVEQVLDGWQSLAMITRRHRQPRGDPPTRPRRRPGLTSEAIT
jgi:hypothetical protein